MPESTSPSPTKKVSLRLAQPQDAEAIASLGSSVFSTSFGFSLPPADLSAYLLSAYSPASITADLSNPLMTTLVAISPLNPTVVGFSQLTRGTTEPCLEGVEKPVELQRLYVDPEYHGGGVGKMLVEGIERVAREEGFKTLWLGVWEENFKAQGFYRRCGFEKCGFHDFKMGECVQRDDIMKKAI